MNTKLLSAGLLLFGISVFSQTVPAPAVQWQTALGGSLNEYATAIQQTTDGGFVLIAQAYSMDGHVTGNHGECDIWVVKLSGYGMIEWKKAFGGSSVETATDIKQTADGGYIVVGGTYSVNGDVTDNAGALDVWLVKLDASGTIEWQKTYGGSSIEMGYSVQQTTDGGYVVAGYTTSIDGDITGNNGSTDMWIIKVDTLGILEWQQSLGGPGAEFAFAIIQTEDGGYAVAGRNTSNGGDVTGNNGGFDAWIVKLDGTGTLEWQRSMGGTGTDFFFSVKQTPDDGYILAGRTSSMDGDVTLNNGNDDCWIVRLDNQGILLWQKTYGGAQSDNANAISLTADGGYILCGESSSTTNVLGVANTTDAWVIKLDAEGNLQWSKALGGNGNDRGASIMQTVDGGYIMAGRSTSSDGDVSTNHGMTDVWVVKLATDYLETPAFATSSLLLFPNPATTQLEISIPNTTIHTLIITDLSGKKILELKANFESIDVSGLASGMYLVEAIAEGKRHIGKLLIR